MNYKVLVLSIILYIPMSALSCDVCGCSASGFYTGALADEERHFIGIRYQHRSFTSEHLPLLEDGASIFSDEVFQQAEFWFRYHITNRLNTTLILPYVFLSKHEEGEEFKINGFGDMVFMLNYSLLRTTDEKDWRHNIQIGTGLKFPTGKSDIKLGKTQHLMPNMQPGTGSFDFLVHANYALTYKNIRLQTEAAAKLNTPSSSDYQYGHRGNLGVSLGRFSESTKGNFQFFPSIGIQFEKALQDYHRKSIHEKNELSGSELLNISAGLDFFFQHFSIGVKFDAPLYQHISEGLVETRSRLSAQFMYLF